MVASRDERAAAESTASRRFASDAIVCAMSTYDRGAVAAIADLEIPVGAKGWPALATGMPASAVAAARWRVLDGDLPLPVLVLREAALEHNVEAMREFCEQAGALHAPHGKTTMAPQLFARQLDAGAWAMTAATPAHLRVYRHIGVGRIVLANQLVEPSAIAWVAEELDAHPELELFCLVDSLAGVALLDGGLAGAGARRALPVLVEMGMPGARAGCRSTAEAIEVARAVADSPRLRLAGVEGFEGLAPDLAGVDAFLDDLVDAVRALEDAGLLGPDALITAGGSAYFDRVVARFAGRRLVLRGGCYLTHDDGMYATDSPLDGRSEGGARRLRNALEVWSSVLSRPEPELAITSMGKRDVGFDRGQPKPTMACALGAHRPRLLAAEVLALSDQHAHIRVDPADELAVGDLVGCTISHPCTTLDRWRVIPTVDDDYRVVGAVHTFF
jgi:D-serine deaminase-like pyridoxal phosphate-dependent protein